HYSITYASRHDYEAFPASELVMRRERDYPPYSKLILITLTHEKVPLLVKYGEQLAAEVKRRMETELQRAEGRLGYEVLGPVASPIPRIKDRYRFQCVVKYSEGLQAAGHVSRTVELLQDAVRQHKLQISVDVDPQVLM